MPNCMVLKTESQCRVCYQGFYLGSQGECVVAGVFEKQAKNRAVVSRVKRGIEEGEVRVTRKVQTILIPRDHVESKPVVVDKPSEKPEKKSLALDNTGESPGSVDSQNAKLNTKGGQLIGADETDKRKEGSKEEATKTTTPNIEKSKPEVEAEENKNDEPAKLTKPIKETKSSNQEQDNEDTIKEKPKSEEIKEEETKTQNKKGTQ